jgi:succinate-semialdehyde dehydrogenase/glutarate-semialdehyde dehydrogenase
MTDILTKDRPMTATRGKLDEPDLLVSKAFVGGKWIGGDGKPIEVDDPYTLDAITEVPGLGKAATGQAIEAASDAFGKWAAMPAKDRGAILRKWFELIEAHGEDLARIMVLENGKTLSDARGEVAYANGFMQFFAEEATRTKGEIIPPHEQGRALYATREPVGVCGVITPWNFPLAMLTRKVGAGLAAGCTMVAKPASATPLTALAYAKLGEEAGLPAGVLNVVTGSAREIGEALTSSMTVRKLSFTGSTEVGVKLYEACAATMKKISMELGGNAPMIIFDDADLDVAVEASRVAKFRNSGQTCIAANRYYVQAGIKDAFLDAFGKIVANTKPGDGFDASSDIGPMIDDAGKEKVLEHRDQAIKAGAQVIAGGGDLDGRMVCPTLLGDVPQGALLTTEETFGPLAGVVTFDTIEDAIRMANDTPFGLAAYFCSQDPKTIDRMGRAIESGMVGINTGLISTPYAPFGGVKMSGLGREGSHHGIEEYLNVKYLCEANL